MRLTKKRGDILKVLQNSNEALSAAAVHKALSDIDLVTIYRNLDLFVKEGLVKRFHFKDEALFEYQENPHHHAICTECDKVFHFDVSESSLSKLIRSEEFVPDVVDITVRGKCSKHA